MGAHADRDPARGAADGRRSAPTARAVPTTRAPSGALGNQALARLAAGSGIRAGGVVHPAVTSAIAARAGRGNRLDGEMANWSRAHVGHRTPHHIRVHHDAQAAGLAASVSARAFTVRNDVFFAAGEYRPHSADGRRLIKHELTHAAQQQGCATGGSLKVSEPGDAYERHADAAAGTPQ
ncbi:MAG: hypothetical protein JWQ20_4095 [Conexibacter sp.]|nr:hypothetical protein [Solirubrobacterales bacterium]MCW3004797.1 hypothetical protein [Conexibacter sp.]